MRASDTSAPGFAAMHEVVMATTEPRFTLCVMPAAASGMHVIAGTLGV